MKAQGHLLLYLYSIVCAGHFPCTLSPGCLSDPMGRSQACWALRGCTGIQQLLLSVLVQRAQHLRIVFYQTIYL